MLDKPVVPISVRDLDRTLPARDLLLMTPDGNAFPRRHR